MHTKENKKVCIQKRKRGGQPGNKNATGAPLKNKYAEGVIIFEQAITISQQISALETTLAGCYYYKVSKFKLYSENKLYIDIRDMIEKGDKILEIE